MCLLSTLSEITTYVNTVLRPFILPILYHVSHLCLSLLSLFQIPSLLYYPFFSFHPSVSPYNLIFFLLSRSTFLPQNSSSFPFFSVLPFFSPS